MERQLCHRDEVKVLTDAVELAGHLCVPEDARSVVLFAHGSGSSRFSTRNRFVAEQLNNASIATLLFDLLTADEEEIDSRTRHLRFDIAMLAERLVGAIDWICEQPETHGLPIGLFGASTGAAAALIAAAERPLRVGAVVSRGGRPDLAGGSLARVECPTLLLVGGLDNVVLELNREAAESIRPEHHVEIIPNATHLFEEPGKLEEVARHARDWFRHHLPGKSPGPK